MPAPSWKITLESRNVFARLAKGSQEPRPCLWNFYLLSRSGGLLLEKLTHSLQIEASKHRLVGCLFLPEGGLLFLPPMIPGSQQGGKADSWRSLLRGCFHGAGVVPRDPHIQGKAKPHEQVFAFQESSSEPQSLTNVLGSYADTSVCETAYPTWRQRA